jgi:outer membrane protein TolC
VWRPQISGNANLGGFRETGGTQPDDTTTGVAAGINISQLIYDAGASTAAVNSATAEALAARAGRQARGNEIALEAARAWIDVWQFEARLALLRQRTAEMDGLIAQMERMAANGMVDRAAMDSARRQVIDITLEETRLRSQLDAAQVRFERLFNRAGGNLGQPAPLLTMAEAEAVTTAWQTAPELQRTAAQMVAAQNAVMQAEAAFRPTARLQAGVSSPMEEGESTDTTLSLMVEYQFGDGGRRRAELASAEARAEAAEEQLTDAQRRLQAELAASITLLRSIERSMHLVAEQIRLSASEAETSRSQITTGQSNLRQLVEAEIENYRAQDRQIAMRAELHTVLLTMAARTGDLSRRLGLETENAS